MAPVSVTYPENCIFIEIFGYEEMPAMAPAVVFKLGLQG